MATRRFVPRTKASVEEPVKRVTRASIGTKEVHTHEEQAEETLGAVRFEPGEEPAFVRVSAGLTINLENYESLRLDCSVTLPCRVEEIEETHQRAAEFVAEKVQQEKQNWIGK